MSVEAREVVMPDLQGAEEITVGAWNKARGENVVEELLLEVGDPVIPGQPIARIAPKSVASP